MKSAASTLLLRKIQWRKMHGKDPLILPCTKSEAAELEKAKGKQVTSIYGCELMIIPDSAKNIVMDAAQ